MRAAAAAAAVYAVATAVFLAPTFAAGPRLGPDLGDPLLNLYFLEWGAHWLAGGGTDLWSPPFYFPTPRALTLSDHLLGPAVAHAVLRAAGLSPVASYDLLLAATFVLSGATAFLALRRAGLSVPGALVGGWVFAFSGFRWSVIGHFQVARMQWIPLLLLSFDRLLERATPVRAAAFLVAYALHLSGGAYLAQLVHFPLAVVLALRWRAAGAAFLARPRLRVLLPAAAVAAVAAAALYAPYLSSPVPLAERRDPASLAASSASLASLVTPSALSLESRLAPWLPRDRGRGAFFPGFVTIALMAVGLAARRKETPLGPWPRGILAQGVLMLAFCFEGPFRAAAALVPGMSAMRVPTRSFAFVALAVAFVAGLGAQRLAGLARRSRAARVAVAAAAIALAAESAPSLGRWALVPAPDDFPAYARWIREHPEVAAYLELPLGRRTSEEAIAMYLQTLHWRPLANGYSGSLTPSFREIHRLCRPYPDPDGLERLGAMGVTHLVIHWRQLDWQPGPRQRARVLRFRPGFEQVLAAAGARLVYDDGATEIRELPGAAAPPR